MSIKESGSSGATLPIQESDVTGLTADLAAKANKSAVTLLPTLAGSMTGQYFIPLGPQVSTTSAVLGNGNERTSPWYCPQNMTITAISVAITSAGDSGCKFRPIIRSDDGTFYPGALLLDVGQLAADAIAVPEATGLSLALTGGTWYWLGGAVQLVSSVQPTVEILNTTSIVLPPCFRVGTTKPAAAAGAVGYFQTGVTGTPTTFSGTLATSQSNVRLRFKLA